MPEDKPRWYNDLKNRPVVMGPRPTVEIVNDIERRVNGPRSRRLNWGLLWIPLAVCLVLIVDGPLQLGLKSNFWSYVEKGKSSTNMAVEDERVFSDSGNLITMDKKWLMPRNTYEAYLAFSKDKTDELLMGMGPLDLLRIYAHASEKGDYETMYALFIQGNPYGTPSREAYLSEVIRDRGLLERSEGQWVAWKKSYRLLEVVDGNQGIIRMVSPYAPSISEHEFRVIKNEKGIWKVAWPAIQ